MSIIQAIKKTEVKVELAKIDANNKVKDLLIETKLEASKLAEKQHADFILERKVEEATLETKIKTLEASFTKQYEKIKKQNENIAKNNQTKTINYILKKVFEI